MMVTTTSPTRSRAVQAAPGARTSAPASEPRRARQGAAPASTRVVSARRAGAVAQEAPVTAVNEVRLRGRLAAASYEIPLPSGDVAASFRLVVDRPASRRRGTTGARVDALECTAFSADLRRKVARFDAGDVVEVEGALQRRFFRSGGGAASRYDVVVTSISRVARVPAAHRATMAG